MKLSVITPNGIKYEGEASRFQFESSTGLMEYLEGHAPMIAEIKAGSFKADDQDIECGNGVVKIENDIITVVCE